MVSGRRARYGPTLFAMCEADSQQARPERAPRSMVSEWEPSPEPDPVSLLEEQNGSREADLVPVRHGRMMVSPFTF